MTSLKRLGCAAVLLAAGLVPGLTGAASAESTTVSDSSADATVIIFGDRRERAERAPEETLTDITSATFDYRRQRLVVAIKVAATKGKGKTVRPFIRVRGGGGDVTFTKVEGGRVLTITRTGKNTQQLGRCKGATITVNSSTDTIRARVPVGCFSAPDRMRVGATVGRSVFAGQQDPRYYVDDASSSRIEADGRYFTPRLLGALDRG